MSPERNGYDAAADEFDPDKVVHLNLTEFLRQEVAFFGSEFLAPSSRLFEQSWHCFSIAVHREVVSAGSIFRYR